MRLRINKNKDGSKNLYVLESFRNDAEKSTTRIVKKLGTYDDLAKEHDDPIAWAEEVVARMNQESEAGKQKLMVPFSPTTILEKDIPVLFDGGYLFLQKLFYQIRLVY